MIKRAIREWIIPGLMILAARTGFTRTEMLNMSLSMFSSTVKCFLPKS